MPPKFYLIGLPFASFLYTSGPLFDIADGAVISKLYSRRRATEFKKFLIAIDKAVPAELYVHLVCDNLSTHKTPVINTWLARHPRFHMHFTPTGSSWLNQVER